MTRTDAEITAEYETNLMTGLVFRRHASSLRSMYGYHPPTGSRCYGDAVQILAKNLAGDRRFCDLFRSIIGKVNPWQTPGESAAAMYEVATAALSAGWFDTLNAASPEPGRHSDNEHTFTLRDRLFLLSILGQATVALGADHQASPGWCWSALCKREGLVAA